MIFLYVIPFVVIAAVLVFDRAAKRKAWRLGSWTQMISTHGTVWVRGKRMKLDGWCGNCETSWRYALPHVTFLRRGPSEPVIGIVVVCQKCRQELEIDPLMRCYAAWWVEKNERQVEQGVFPDPREFDDIRAALRVGG